MKPCRKSPVRSTDTLQSAFTLVELLVVITIVGILAAILFPVFASAKDTSKRAVDLSNQKQIGLAMLVYCNDNDDEFPRNDYRTLDRTPAFPLTFREAVAAYVGNGMVMERRVSKDGSSGPIASQGIWFSPDQPPNTIYGYATNGAVCPSADLWNWSNGGNEVYHDQNEDGSPTGIEPAPSASQSGLGQTSDTLMICTIGVNPSQGSANVYMSSGVWYWRGAQRAIPGATIPPEWDADNSKQSADGNDPGPTEFLPRFRFEQGLNAVYCDGHGKYKKKGTLSWCRDMFAKGRPVDPGGGAPYDDGHAFLPGRVCYGWANP